ncbi:metallopeptidase TldD-related protein [Pseudonocardia abyssalis]|uniref:TldD/PmbA family protein n=1 Tax=Pseudonocardia abyssalis TaxID=2792008 RepID=A0ABS6V0D1_9PSEU|nr:metallopeptidase TldD-related protein [Pseudonocardia abyssalis]MBW0118180.1 TldD/PmbA family protein [Pseudonocardia abyssalis]MBW0137578.1 TldD/PmbA family protein [Pseudonocardia abyssalis]
MRPQEIVERTLAAATHLRGCVVLVQESSEAVLRWANSTMTTNGHTTSGRVTVIALVAVDGGTAAGVVSTAVTITDPARLEDLVRAAEASARDAGPAEDAMDLPSPTDTDASWDDDATETSIGVFGAFAQGLAEVLAGPQRQYGFASHELTTTWLGTSAGVRRRWVQPTGSVELNAKTPDLSGSAWVGASTADFADVDVVDLAAQAARRLEWGERKVELPAGKYETLLPPSAVSDLMIYLAWSMDGRPAHEGRSALSGPDGTRVGERLGALPLTLTCDPAAPGMEYAPFLSTTRSGDAISVFDNGAPVGRVDWVREGVVSELGWSRAEAAEFGTAFTPPGDNLLLTGGSDASLEEMVGRTERGLLLTCLWYIRLVDPATLLLTGLTRDGVYLVEGGEIVGEVDHNFRFNHSPLDVLRQATEAGATERTLPREWKDWFTRAAMPPVRVPEFTMSSVSLGR